MSQNVCGENFHSNAKNVPWQNNNNTINMQIHTENKLMWKSQKLLKILQIYNTCIFQGFKWYIGNINSFKSNFPENIKLDCYKYELTYNWLDLGFVTICFTGNLNHHTGMTWVTRSSSPSNKVELVQLISKLTYLYLFIGF